MEIPVYAIVGRIPVKAERNSEGVVELFEYDKSKGGFVKNMRFFSELWKENADTDFLTKEEFAAYIRALRDG